MTVIRNKGNEIRIVKVIVVNGDEARIVSEGRRSRF
jgi:hypothetical protein